MASGGGDPSLPACDFGPLQNFVGSYGEPSSRSSNGPGRRRALQQQQQQGAAGDTTAGGVVKAANTIFPGWCSNSSWRVELTRPGATLYPQDVHHAMVATRIRHLGQPVI